jgi:putative DNA primase/helicase
MPEVRRTHEIDKRMNDPFADTIRQLNDFGIMVRDLVFDRFVRHHTDRAIKDAQWYVLRRWRSPKTGKEYIFGTAGDWSTGNRTSIEPEAEIEDRKELADQRKAIIQQETEEHQKAQAYAADAAELKFSKASEKGSSPYLLAKKVHAHGVRFDGENVLIPMKIDNNIVGIQTIRADGSKRFTTDCAKKGSSFLIGTPIPHGILAVAEGYATAASVHEATGWPVAVAFDAGNLEPASVELKKRFTNNRFVFCADDDYLTDGNPGLTKARAAAKSVKGIVLAPRFVNRNNQKWTDWNDLAVHEGASKVRRQLLEGICPVVTTSLADVQARNVDWIWPGVIPKGALTMWAGKQGLGKSFMVSDIAARFSTGRPMPDGTENHPGKVLMLSREDPLDCVTKPRLISARADMTRITWSEFRDRKSGKLLTLVENMDVLSDMIRDGGFSMIFIDTFSAFAGNTDQNSAGEVRDFLDPLAQLAQKTGSAVIVITHMRKAAAGTKKSDIDPMDAIAGSVQMTGAVRVAAILDTATVNGEEVRWFFVSKTNMGEKLKDGWTWKLVKEEDAGPDAVPHISWTGTEDDFAITQKIIRSSGPVLDQEVLAGIVRDILSAGPKPFMALASETWQAIRLIPGMDKVSKTFIKDGINSLGAGVLSIVDAPRRGRMVCLPGQEPEAPKDKALRLARENPDWSISRLAREAGCRKEAALDIILEAKSGSQTIIESGSQTDRLSEPASVSEPVVTVPKHARAYIGRAGLGTGTADAQNTGSETDDEDQKSGNRNP